MTTTTAYRAGLAVALGTALFLLWGMGALGIIGVEGDRADLMYLGVLAIGVVGTVVVRGRAHGMALVLVAMAAAQVLVGMIALAAGLGPVNPRIEIIGLTGMFMTMFLASAWLFQQAAGRRATDDGRTT